MGRGAVAEGDGKKAPFLDALGFQTAIQPFTLGLLKRPTI